ncbi:hypothetical protein [Sorangium sp. So ce513]|uniref:hypothetical protein n=1 Tax=Sorangium sp. So ce513 TaxID=3133315 RepID=UPI003F6137B6
MTTPLPPPRILAPAPVERAHRCAWDEASRTALDPAEQAALAALDRWLAEPDRPYALLHGPRASRRAAVAAHLVRTAQGGATHTALLAPIGPDLRLERDLIALLASRLLPDYAGGPPRRLRAQIAEEHLRPGPSEGEPSLLVAVTDVEEAEPLLPWPALFSDVGPRVKVLATVEGDDATAQTWIQRLGFEPARTSVHALPPQPWPASIHPAALLAAAGAAPAALLGLLSVAYGRLREEEITAALRTPIEGALAGVEPLLAVAEGTYAFRWNAARREVEEHLDVAARKASMGRLLSLAPEGYVCAYARAHLEQAAAPPAAFAALVTERHLTSWLARPEGYLGFVADLERVRRRAVEAIASDQDATALALRAALVEASVSACAGREDDDAPVGVERIDRETPLADEREQAKALTALGAAMGPGAARVEVLARAEDAARRITDAEARGDALIALAEAAEGDARYAFARDALAAYRDAADPILPQLVAVNALPPDEGVAVAREVLARLRDDGGDPGDLAVFAGRFPRPVAEALWPEAEALPEPAQARVLAALAEALGDRDRVRAAFGAVEQHADPYDPLSHQDLARLVPLLDRAEARRAAALAQRFGERATELLEGLVPRLRALGDPAEDLLDALPEASRVRALVRSFPFAAEPDQLRARVGEALRGLEPLERYGLLFDVGPWLAAAGDADALLAAIEPLGDAHLLSALAFLARHDPTQASGLARRALPLALRLGTTEPHRLLDLVPQARHLPAEGVATVLGLLFDALAGESRPAALAGDGPSLVRLVPLIAALGGDEGLAAAAREIVQVAAWFP